MGRVMDRLKQEVRGEIPQNILERSIMTNREIGLPAGAVPVSRDELSDIPRALASSAADFAQIPGTPINIRNVMDVPEPETEYGENIKLASDIAPLAYAGVGAARGLSKLGSFMEMNKVKKIQKAFGPWAKGKSDKYGAELKSGYKNLLKKGGGTVSKKEIDDLISPIKYADKATKSTFPRSVIKATQRLSESKEGVPIQTLRKELRIIRESMSKGEKSGSVFSTRTRPIKQVVTSGKKMIKEKIPEMKKADAWYGPYAERKKIIESSFDPHLASSGDVGTIKGTSTLRNILNKQPGEVSAIRSFGEETGIPIVGPAKLAAVGRGTAKTVGTLGGIGASLWLLNKLFGNKAGKEASQVIDIQH